MSRSSPHAHDETARRLALASTLVVLATVLTVFYDLTTTFGGTPWLVLYVALAFAGATLAARRAPTRLGVAAAVALLSVGLLGYVVLLPSQYYGLFTLDAFLDDLGGWLTGQSVKLMLEADLWAVGIAPAPVFLTWYLALRGRYDAATLSGAAALGFFVLTGDLGGAATLVGVAGLLSLAGFGAVATAEGGWRQLQEVGLVVGLVLLLTRLVQVVPASGGGTLGSGGGDGEGATLERTLLGDRDSTTIGSSPSLTPTPRFTVEADESAYWHTRSFDEYRGQGWGRTDRAMTAERPLDPPPSSGTTLQQSVTVESPTGTMPAAWKPVLLDSDDDGVATVTETGSLEPVQELEAGDGYTVISEVPSWTEDDLAAAAADYDDDLLQRYTQLPDGLPDRLAEKVDDIVEGAAGPYETALAVQGWLEREKSYSLNVERRDWDIADAFVFALDSGYCVYFATAMAVMLRTQGVPARYVVGYSPGEQVADGEWLLRGLHSHAWVEVYFDGIGWVTFDPTPAGPRQEAEQREVERAQAAGGAAGSDATTTATGTPTPTPTPTPTEATGTTGPNGTTTPTGNASELLQQGEALGGPEDGLTPTQDGVAAAVRSSEGTDTATPTASGRGGGRRGGRLWLLGAVATLAFGSVRLGYAQSALRSVRMRYQRRTGDPDRDVERALGRLESHLASKFRPRAEGETHHQYLRALEDDHLVPLDERAWRVLDLYHRSRYGEGVGEAAADEAVGIVDEVVRE